MRRFCTALFTAILLWNLGYIDAAHSGNRRVQKSDLPFGSEFSPSQIELAKVLELAHKHGGDWRAFEASVYETYFENYHSSEKNRRKLANNTKLGMIAYGVIDRGANLTELGDRLYALREDPAKLHEALATHMLRNLLGMTFVQTVLEKPFLVTPTRKFDGEVLAPLLKQLDQQIAPQLRPLLRKTLAAILAEIDSKNRNVRGLALEALAFKLMRLVDLHYVGTRVRGEATGGAEVDLLFEGSRLSFSRWQVQCKNTKTVGLDDVAKEVGLTRVLNSNVIVIVTTGRISAPARKYADGIMKTSNLNMVMIDGRDLSWVTDNPPAIVEVFKREAEHAMAIKALKDIYD